MFWLAPAPVRPPVEDPSVLLLRPSDGYGDHLMVSAVVEGVKAEYPDRRIYMRVRHPEIFHLNPHVESFEHHRRIRKRYPEILGRYAHLTGREPQARHLQVSGHLIEDMYGCVGLPVAHRPRQPRIYLNEREEAYREKQLERLPRPRIAVAPHGKQNVRLPNKIYPADQWHELGRLLRPVAGSLIHLGTRKDGPLLKGALDMRDLGYRKTASVLQRCDLLVCHVGGLMHLAAAVRTRAVVLYGAAEHPAISGYEWNRNVYVPIECGPCWMEEPCSHLSCMRLLTPEYALREVEAALAEGPVPRLG